jgi:hypothetical protein
MKMVARLDAATQKHRRFASTARARKAPMLQQAVHTLKHTHTHTHIQCWLQLLIFEDSIDVALYLPSAP